MRVNRSNGDGEESQRGTPGLGGDEGGDGGEDGGLAAVEPLGASLHEVAHHLGGVAGAQSMSSDRMTQVLASVVCVFCACVRARRRYGHLESTAEGGGLAVDVALANQEGEGGVEGEAA